MVCNSSLCVLCCQDGFLDNHEVAQWILPGEIDHTDNEAKHLIHETDTDKVRISPVQLPELSPLPQTKSSIPVHPLQQMFLNPLPHTILSPPKHPSLYPSTTHTSCVPLFTLTPHLNTAIATTIVQCTPPPVHAPSSLTFSHLPPTSHLDFPYENQITSCYN